MVGIGRRHDGRIGMQLQERAVELVGLDDQARPRSQHQITPEIFRYAAQKGAAPSSGDTVEPSGHRRSGRLAVRAGNGHHVLSLRNRAEQPRALDHLETAVAKEAQLRMILGDRRRIDDQRIVAAAETGRYRVGRLVIGHLGALAPQLGRQLRGRTVVTGHAPAFVQKIARLGAHADSAYA